MLYNDANSEVDARIPRGMHTLYGTRAENVASSSTVDIFLNCSDLTIKSK